MNSKDVALTTICASLYVIIGSFIPFASFGPLQCRISDALYPLIAVVGTPALIGLTIGHVIYNIYGYTLGTALGIFDVILSPILFFIFGKLPIWKFGYKGVPFHVIAVALWVPFLVCLVNPNTPWIAYWPIVMSVGSGEAFAELIIGIPIAKAVDISIPFLKGAKIRL